MDSQFALVVALTAIFLVCCVLLVGYVILQATSKSTTEKTDRAEKKDK